MAAQDVGRRLRNQPHGADRRQYLVEVEGVGGEIGRLHQADRVARPKPKRLAPLRKGRGKAGGRREQGGRDRRLDHRPSIEHSASLSRRQPDETRDQQSRQRQRQPIRPPYRPRNSITRGGGNGRPPAAYCSLSAVSPRRVIGERIYWRMVRLSPSRSTSAVMPTPIGIGRPLRSRSAVVGGADLDRVEALAGALVDRRVGRDADDAAFEHAVDRAVVGGDRDPGRLAHPDEGDVGRADLRLDQQALVRTARSRPPARPARIEPPRVVTSTRLIRPASGARSTVRWARSASAGRARRRAAIFGLGGGELGAGLGAPFLAAPGRAPSAPRRRRRGRGRSVSPAASMSLRAMSAALSAWIRLSRGSMPRSTSGRISRASVLALLDRRDARD